MTTRSKFVEQKINKLLLVSNEHNIEKEISPTVKKLFNQKNVQKLRKKFERLTKNLSNNSSDDDNCVKIETNSLKSPTSILTKENQSFDCVRGMGSSISFSTSLSVTLSPKKLNNKIDKIYDESIRKERKYITKLEIGIENYVEIPKEIFHEKFNINKSTILPEIISCQNDVIQLAAIFIRFIENSTFYAYIKYPTSHFHAKDMVTSQLQLFGKNQSLYRTRLDVQSLMLQPIQKLPKYPPLFKKMIKTLLRNMHENNLCVAKRMFEIYLDRMNQSLELNDIVEAYQLLVKLQYGELTNLQTEFGVDVNEPFAGHLSLVLKQDQRMVALSNADCKSFDFLVALVFISRAARIFRAPGQ